MRQGTLSLLLMLTGCATMRHEATVTLPAGPPPSATTAAAAAPTSTTIDGARQPASLV
jgi:hypothetical protein